MNNMIELQSVSKRYRIQKNTIVTALDDVNLSVARGEFIAVRGVSGSGKTTLLMIIAALLPPSAGRVVFEEKGNLYAMNGRERAHFRGHRLTACPFIILSEFDGAYYL
jgi:putative ABC transport system ATP-binding protein